MDNIPVPISPIDSTSKVEGSKFLGCMFGCLAFFFIGLCVFLVAGDLGFSFIKSWFTSETFSLSGYFWDNYPDLLKLSGITIALFGFSLLQFKFTSSLGTWLIDLSFAILVIILGISVATTITSLATMITKSPLDYLPQITNDISIGMRVGSRVGVPIAMIQLFFVGFLRRKEIIPSDPTVGNYFREIYPFSVIIFLLVGTISGFIAGHERWGRLGAVLGMVVGVIIPLILFVQIINDKKQ